MADNNSPAVTATAPCLYCNDVGVIHDMAGNALGPCYCASDDQAPDLLGALEQSLGRARAARRSGQPEHRSRRT